MPLVDKNKMRTPISVTAKTKPSIQVQPTKKILVPSQSSLPQRKWTGNLDRIGVSVEEAAVMLSLSVRSVWVLIKDGRIRHVRFGTRVIVSVQSLREFVDGKGKPITPSKEGESQTAK